MGHSLCLLTASLLAAQTPQSGVIYSQPAHQSGCDCRQGHGGHGSHETFPRLRGFFRSANQGPVERPGLVNRLRDWFGGDQSYAVKPHHSQPYSGQFARMQPTTPASITPRTATTEPVVPARTVSTIKTTPNTPILAPAQTPVLTPAQPLPIGPVLEPTREPELANPKLAPTLFRPATTSMPPRRESKINPKFVDKIGHEDDYSWITGQLDQEGGRWLIRYATPDTIDRYHGELPLAAGASVNGLNLGDLVSATGQVIGQGNSIQYRVSSINLIERK